MKKLLNKVSLFALLFAFVFMFVGCTTNEDNKESKEEQKQEEQKQEKENKDPVVHVCVFDKKVEEEKYLKTNATCEEGAVYYMSCTCGEKGSETFQLENKLGHLFEHGSLFTTHLERIDADVEAGAYRIYYVCARCNKECTMDGKLDSHDHIAHEYSDLENGTHSGVCALCGEDFVDNCTFGNENACVYCESDLVPTAVDNPVFNIIKGLIYEELTQQDLKDVYRYKGEETYASITVNYKKYTYNDNDKGNITEETKNFIYNESDNTYYDGEIEIGSYGWFPVSFKVNKCVDVVGESHYIRLSNGNYAVYYFNTETTNMATIHIFNLEGQLLTYKNVHYMNETSVELEVYRYSYTENK